MSYTKRQFTIRKTLVRDAYAIAAVIREAFLVDCAPVNSETGILFFVKVQNPGYFKRKVPEFISAYVAEQDGMVVGEIAMSEGISSLFVLPEYQKMGIGKRLIATAIPGWAEKSKKDIVIVNSSPNAVSFYENIGFAQIGEEQLNNDVRCIPMKADITTVIGRVNS